MRKKACSAQDLHLLLQDMVLFNDTIFYNISYGRPDATAEEVYDAARRVRAAEHIIACTDAVISRRGSLRCLKGSLSPAKPLSLFVR